MHRFSTISLNQISFKDKYEIIYDAPILGEVSYLINQFIIIFIGKLMYCQGMQAEIKL